MTLEGNVTKTAAVDSSDDALHKLSVAVIKLEKVVQTMYDSAEAATDPAYYAATVKLDNICGALNNRIGFLHTQQIPNLASQIKDGTDALQSKVIELANIVNTINTVDQVLQIISGIAALAAGLMPK